MRRRTTGVAIGLGLVLVLVALPERAQAAPAPARVAVTMTERACKVSRRQLKVGAAMLAIANRSRRARRFQVAGRRSQFLRRGRRAKLKVTFRRAGRYTFTCTARGLSKRRGVKRGVIVVTKVAAKPKPKPNRIRSPRHRHRRLRFSLRLQDRRLHHPHHPAPPPPPHILGVRPAMGGDEFYNRNTGQKFVPRGSTFARRQLNQGVFGPSTFIVGSYNHAAADLALAAMQAENYNVVRIFLDVRCTVGCLTNTLSVDHLSRPYLTNVAAFMQLAKSRGIFTLISLEALPYGSKYEDLWREDCCATFGAENLTYLNTDGVNAHRQFWQALHGALRSVNAPLDYVWGYELVSEAFFRDGSPPLSFGSGLVTTANGSTYDMSVPAQKQAMMDENLVHWVNQVRAAILAVDPTALVSLGTLWPKSPNPARAGDTRVIRAQPLYTSNLDFVGLHLHPGVELTYDDYMENYELTAPVAKPVVLGDFGAFQFAYPTVADAERALKGVQADSCASGIDGWVFFSWDTTEFGSGEAPLWNGMSPGGSISQALGPRLRPDPCDPVPGPGNLALNRPVTASASVDGPATNVVDGLMATSWGAGGYPQQWIEIDLGAPVSIGRIRLFVAQTPNGLTTHSVEGRELPTDPWTQLHEFNGFTNDGSVIEQIPGSPWTNVRYLRVNTTAGVSWVAWREIEIFAP